jgi:prepilin-type N-terminal cleavage/methylation domain-containing protein
MQKSNLIRKGRKGFTLVEVALAVAVGLIVIGGAIVGFNSVRENAQNSAARQKVDAGVAIVESIAASNNQMYPASNATTPSIVSTTWQKQRTDWNANPWGGPAGDAVDGVTEVNAAAFGSAVQPAPGAAQTLAMPVQAPGTNEAGNLIYQSANGTQWAVVTDASTGATKTVKGYYVSIFDKTGTAWYVNSGSK